MYSRRAHLDRVVDEALGHLEVALVEELLELLPVVQLDWRGQAVPEAVHLYVGLKEEKGKGRAKGA